MQFAFHLMILAALDLFLPDPSWVMLLPDYQTCQKVIGHNAECKCFWEKTKLGPKSEAMIYQHQHMVELWQAIANTSGQNSKLQQRIYLYQIFQKLDPVLILEQRIPVTVGGELMKAHGDIESVNLGTGERGRRVAGNGGSRLMTDQEIADLFAKAKLAVKHEIEKERAGEQIDQGLMDLRLCDE